MLTARLLVVASLPALLLASPALSEGVTSVTLSSGGLAEIESRHAVSGDGRVRLEIPAEQLDDILKSLVVRDPVGAVRGVSLDGPSQAEETLRGMPFKAEDVASPARLATALQGVGIRVESDGKTVEGQSLGVSERGGGRDEGVVHTLSVLTRDGAVDTVRLVEGASIRILDEAMAGRLREAATALGAAKASGARGVEIALSGGGDRDVSVSYVVPAPVWKTAYRVVAGSGDKARLQAWAVIENATGADWNNVAVTLQSGAPVTLKQRLFQRYWRARPEVPVDVERNLAPDVDQGAAPAVARQDKEPSYRFSGGKRFDGDEAPKASLRALEAAAPAPISQAAETADVAESAVAATYRLPTPVSLAAGRTLSTPIVDAEMPAERVSLWRPGDGPHPIAAISVKNASRATLPPGILTVYDEAAGYVGDARLPATPAGEERMASFATDRKVTVRSEEKPEETVTGVKVVDGVARISVVSRSVTTYAVKGAADGPRIVVIEHPRRDGWTFASPELSGATPIAHRLKAKLAAGESRDIAATYEMTRLDAFSLADADEAQLLHWAASPADARTAEKLRGVAGLRGSIAAAERDVEKAGEEIDRLRAEQERIRANMASAPRESEFGKKLLRQLEMSEGRIAAAGEARDKAERAQDALRAEMSAAIAAF